MAIELGVVMDPIGSAHFKKDTTLGILLEAQNRKWKIFYMEVGDLFLRDGKAYAKTRELKVFNDSSRWFEFGSEIEKPLGSLDCILMRKDPPFDIEFIYTTYILEHAEKGGALVVNRPQSLRDANEKMFATWFPHCMAPTLVARDAQVLRAFLSEQQEIVLKPLEGMGGAMVFRLKADDANTNVTIDTLTKGGAKFVMAQKFLPEIAEGDRRIVLIDGEPIPYVLARIPAQGDFRGNLAQGAKGVGAELTEREKWICGEIAPTLKEKGLIFVGLDVIGGFVTEINVTSPTCVRELEALYPVRISAKFLDALEHRLKD